MEMKILIFLHILTAVIFAGYYLFLALKNTPSAIKSKDIGIIISFEKQYNKLAMYSLIIQILTGFRLAMLLSPMGQWFSFSNPISSGIGLKFILLAIIIVLIIVKKAVFSKKENLTAVVVNIYLMAILSLLFIWTGVSLRLGGL